MYIYKDALLNVGWPLPIYWLLTLAHVGLLRCAIFFPKKPQPLSPRRSQWRSYECYSKVPSLEEVKFSYTAPCASKWWWWFSKGNGPWNSPQIFREIWVFFVKYVFSPDIMSPLNVQDAMYMTGFVYLGDFYGFFKTPWDSPVIKTIRWGTPGTCHPYTNWQRFKWMMGSPNLYGKWLEIATSICLIQVV